MLCQFAKNKLVENDLVKSQLVKWINRASTRQIKLVKNLTGQIDNWSKMPTSQKVCQRRRCCCCRCHRHWLRGGVSIGVRVGFALASALRWPRSRIWRRRRRHQRRSQRRHFVGVGVSIGVLSVSAFCWCWRQQRPCISKSKMTYLTIWRIVH